MGERKLRSLLHYVLWLMRRGAMRTQALTEVGTFDPGTTLDVPGALRGGPALRVDGGMYSSANFWSDPRKRVIGNVGVNVSTTPAAEHGRSRSR